MSSFDMDPYYLNPSSSSHAPGDEFVPPVQSINQDFLTAPSLQASASEYISTVSQESYSLLGQDSQGTSHAPYITGRNSSRSHRSSVTGDSVRTPSLFSHPYHQARLCHIADHTSVQRLEWSRPSFPPFPVSGLAPGTVIMHNTDIGDTTTHYLNPSQLSRPSKKISPTLTFGSVSQSNIVNSNTNEDNPSLTGGLMVPEQTFLPAFQTPPSSPYTPADQADIEYAHYRYGNKRCFYRCRFDLAGSPCNQWIVGDRTRVLRHLRNHHHLQTGPTAPAICRWDECTHSRPMKQENLSRHVVMHLGVKWKCPHCRRFFSRDDAVHRHIERMAPGVDVTDVEVIPGRGARALTEPQSKRARVA